MLPCQNIEGCVPLCFGRGFGVKHGIADKPLNTQQGPLPPLHLVLRERRELRLLGRQPGASACPSQLLGSLRSPSPPALLPCLPPRLVKHRVLSLLGYFGAVWGGSAARLHSRLSDEHGSEMSPKFGNERQLLNTNVA